MRNTIYKSVMIALSVVTAIVVLLLNATGAAAVELPTQFVLSSHIGEVGKESEKPGGFTFPESVAVAPDGNIYVAEAANHRIQEFDHEGKFVLMFGWNVNKTKVKEGATQAERNVCIEVEVEKGAECGAGEALGGSAAGAGQVGKVQDVTIDQSTGNIFMWDPEYDRVDEFTADGEFVLMIGGEVNETKDHVVGATEEEKNLCTAVSGDVCQAGKESVAVSTARGAFKPEEFSGDLLAVGGPSDLLYVGDEARVQEFKASTGEWAGQVSLTALSATGKVNALTVDPSGELFVVDGVTGTVGAGPIIPGIHKYNSKGELQPEIIDPGSESGVENRITAIASDVYGRIGLIEHKKVGNSSFDYHGVLYGAAGEVISEFAPPSGVMSGDSTDLTFNTPESLEPLSERLYVAEPGAQDIEVYAPIVFPEVHTCVASEIEATSATLCGEMNPKGLTASGLFDYSPPAGANTPVVLESKSTKLEPFDAHLSGLEPNQTYKYTALARAEVNGEVVQGSGSQLEFHTLSLSPEVPGAPEASFIKAQSAVLSASINPEHAVTSYHFEYGLCPTLERCDLSNSSEIRTTPNENSSEYGLIGVTDEVSGLDPQRTYSFRLVSNNGHEEEREGKTVTEGGEKTGEEGAFTTLPTASVAATTGPANTVTLTSAVISGTVDPSGEPATYRFELGVSQGSSTQYGIVFSGLTGAGVTPIVESLALTGLQPGVVYAYRIAISSGYGNATGATAEFTTQGLPSVLVAPVPLAQLPIPAIAFPKATGPAKPKAKAKKKTKAKTKKAGKSKKDKKKAHKTSLTHERTHQKNLDKKI